MNDLQALINEYNEIETTQAARLKAIYQLAAAQPGGGHEVRFSNAEVLDQNILNWSGHADGLNQRMDKLTALITHWQ